MYQLDDILGNAVAFRLLSFFLKNPTRQFYRSQVTREVKIAKASAGKWLRALEGAGVVGCEERANAKFYQLNANSVFVKQLKVLFSLSKILPTFRDFDEEAYIYGSVARGEDTGESDVDLLVISTRGKKQLLKQVDTIAKKLGREIKPTIFTPVGFSRLAREDRPFYERVSKDRIRISDAK